MSGQAKITSVESLERFYRTMLQFSEESLACLEKIRCEVIRRQQILDEKLPAKWNSELAKWKSKMKDARRDLNSSRTTTGRLEAEQLYRKAKGKVREAEEKLEKIKKWQTRLPNQLPESQARLLKLKTFLINDFEKGTHLIKSHAATLHDYTEIKESKK